MPSIGTTTKPSGGWHSFQGSSQVQQEANRLTMPAHGDITDLGAWIGGWNGTCRVHLCVWDDAGVLLESVGPITVANEGAGGPAGGNVALYTAPLATPVRLAAGVAFYVGFDRHNSDGHQVSVAGSGTPDHFEGRHGGSTATWPAALGAASGGPSNAPRSCGMYVANYDLVPGAKVYRSGAWLDADGVQAFRSGAWVDVDGVQLERSGAWVDSE
jgi:hypothetical protein